MRIGSLFSGIGGFELGLEWSGLGHTLWQVERDEYCRSILAEHWPSVERFEDVCSVGKTTLAPVDIICGGFPCQDVSSAGKGAGLAGERSGLWFEFARIVGELRPRWVIVENVTSGANRWVDTVCASLAELGYATLPFPLSAADVGAPHLRRRIFIVAYANSEQLREQSGRSGGPTGREAAQPAIDGAPGASSDPYGFRLEAHGRRPGPSAEHTGRTNRNDSNGRNLPGVRLPNAGWGHERFEPSFRRGDDGLPCGMARAEWNRQLKALGNAVVPQCAEVIGHIILELAKTQ